jgi:cytochrome c oxidase subunit 2
MKNLLKIFAIAAALGMVPAAASAQHNPPVYPALSNAQKAQLPAQPEAVSPAAPASGGEAPSAATVANTTMAAATRAAPSIGIGQPDGRLGLQQQFSPIGEEAAWFHNIILLPIITIISLLVLFLLLYVVVRFRRSAHPVPSRTTHNTALEVIWTGVPVLILVAIMFPSIQLLARQYSPPKADLTVKVIGNQWYWTYQYPDNGDFEVVSNILSDAEDKKRGEPRMLGVDERMVVPAGAVVKLIVTSNDVIHSFGVPSFWVKIDAVPGRLNEYWFKVNRPGVYYGQCFELCGARHGYMPVAVEVVSRAQFAAWIASKGGTMPGAVKPTSPDATQNSPISNPGVATAPAVTAASGDQATPAPSNVVQATSAAQTTNQAAQSREGGSQ